MNVYKYMSKFEERVSLYSDCIEFQPNFLSSVTNTVYSEKNENVEVLT